MTNISISVRDLVEFTFVHEDISPSTSIDAMQKGTISHRARQSKLPDTYIVEYPIKSDFTYKEYIITVQGRMDAFYDSSLTAIIEEIKLCDSKNPPSSPIDRHMYQAYVYSALLYNNRANQENVDVVLSYCSEKGKVLAKFEESISREKSIEIINSLIKPYIDFIIDENNHIENRNYSILDCIFPFEKYRVGQKEMATQVYTAIRLRRKLFASLPTGIGKTMASVFPAIKAMQQGLNNKIMYLTARTAARQAPVKSLKLLQDSGIDIRVLIISAKEKVCLHDMQCNPNHCPYAKGHYVRQKLAIQDILSYNFWDSDIIHDISVKYEICPFEFSLSLYYLADIIICDYNYVFDPFVKLVRAEQEKSNITLLIDEAHQLVPRLRDSLSASLSTALIDEWKNVLKQKTNKLDIFVKNLRKLKKYINENIDVFEESHDTSDISNDLVNCCEDIKLHCLSFFSIESNNKDQESSDTIAQIYKSINQFLFAESNIKNSYKIIFSHNSKDSKIELFCVDPRFQIIESLYNMAGSVFFSATLMPLTNMKKILGGTDVDATFTLPSPFSKNNLLVLRSNISTYYKDRANTIAYIADKIIEIIHFHKANYIIYMPSYEYMEMLSEYLDSKNIDHIIQNKNMSDSDKLAFLENFNHDSHVLALCVMGGSFSEGIDLPGSLLYGAIIVGVGLQKPDEKSEIIKDYFDKKYGLGYEFAYLYPAIHKILQATGRVIRSENDKGLIMLIDKRYYNKNYYQLLPSEWEYIDRDYNNKIAKFNT